jgi:hypothetical protein
MQLLLKALFITIVFSSNVFSAPAYIIPVAPGWKVQPIITVGESAGNGYAMAGVPDGLGVFANNDGTFNLLMNHEIPNDKGATRTHGEKGAFVSRWVIDIEGLKVKSGSDLIKSTVPNGLKFNRFCSADLPPISAFYNAATRKGFNGQLFLNGEEDKAGGRAFAHTLEGISYLMPDFGHIAWENLLANPVSQDRTLVIGLDDIQDGLLLVYLGNKTKVGNPVEQSGLVGGQLYAIKVTNERFSLVPLTGMTSLDGKTLREEAKKLGATGFARPEDGAWDALDASKFWFATTDKIGGDSRLNQLVFDDISNPLHGGRISAPLSAQSIGAEMFDNIVVDGDGRVLAQEDPGENARLAVIWMYEPTLNKTTKLFESNPDLFKPGAADFMTIDEEHSGIVEVTSLLRKASWFDTNHRYYLGTTQAHLDHKDTKLVEHGQLWLISGPSTKN